MQIAIMPPDFSEGIFLFYKLKIIMQNRTINLQNIIVIIIVIFIQIEWEQILYVNSQNPSHFKICGKDFLI